MQVIARERPQSFRFESGDPAEVINLKGRGMAHIRVDIGGRERQREAENENAFRTWTGTASCAIIAA